MRHPIDPAEGRVLWASAALNSKAQDRYMHRESLQPVQRIINGRAAPLPYFERIGELGVSALALLPGGGLLLSTGHALMRIDTDSGHMRHVNVDGLIDAHELSLIGDRLWIANTGADEVLEFDSASLFLSRRLSLAGFRGRMPDSGHDGRGQHSDRFHCNQVFEGLDGNRYALVHHVSGFQTLHKVAERLIKSHGHGGVLNLDRGNILPLGLKAPHSVRIVEDRYLVCDSGANLVRMYDRQWRLQHGFATRGFGRGAAWCEQSGLYYVGISSTRARYVGIQPGPEDCRVQVFDTRDFVLRAEVSVPNAEQISNLYLMPSALAFDHMPAETHAWPQTA